MKRILSLILTASLAAGLLTSCGKSGGEGENKTKDTPMGRYIEEQLAVLDPMDRVYTADMASDGSLVLYCSYTKENMAGSSVSRLVLPADGGSVQTEQLTWLKEYLGEGAVVLGISESDAGLYILYRDNQSAYRLALKTPEGAPQEIKVPDLDAASQAMPGGFSVIEGTAGSVQFGSAGTMEEGDITLAPKDSAGVTFSSGSPEAEANAEDPGAPSMEDTEASGVSEEKSGAVSAAPPRAYQETDKIPTGLKALPGGQFLLLFGQAGASLYDQQGGTARFTFPGTVFNGNVIAVSDGRILMPGDDYPERKEMYLYDIAKGEQVGTQTYENLSFGSTVGMDAEGIYLADATGIYRQAQGGTIWEKLVEGDLTLLAMPNLSIDAVVSDGKGGFYGLLGDEDGEMLLHYSYSAETPTNPDTELTIAGLRNSPTIRQAIGEFQRRNPTVRVNFQVMLEEDSAATAEDVIRALNTELLNGKGPDLLLLDGLPVDAYIEKGVLVDLSAQVEGLIASGSLMENLLGGYIREGKYYGVPSRFSFPVMMGSTADVDAVRSLGDLADKVETRQGEEVPFLRTPSFLREENGVVEGYAEGGAALWLNDDGSLNGEAVTEYFRQTMRLDKTLKEYSPELGGMVASFTVAVKGGRGTMAEALDMGAMDLRQGLSLFHTQKLAGPMGLSMLIGSLSGLADVKLDTLFGSGLYYPAGSVGIVSTTEQRPLCEAFLDQLLSATVQEKQLGDGYPVNGEALSGLVEDALSGLAEDALTGARDLGFLDLCRSLKTPVLADQVVMDAVLSQAKDLLDGSVTPEAAAAKVQEKTSIYLSE